MSLFPSYYARLDKLQVHRLDSPQILVDDRLHGPSAFRDVALQPSDEPRVVIGVDEDLDVHELTQGRIREDQNALDDDCPPRKDGLVHRFAGVLSEIIERQVDASALFQRQHVADEQVGLERVRMVVVQGRAFVEREIVAIPVITVVFEHDDPVGSERLDNRRDDGRLAGARSARHADDHRSGTDLPAVS